MIRPPKLQPGDTIGIVATARKVTEQEMAPAIEFLEKAGFKVKTAAGLYHTFYQFAGSDESRAQDLQQFINDPEIKAIWCARGGYGTVRILPMLDLSPLNQFPKWIIGFSDVTALLAKLYAEGIMGIHGPMAINWFSTDPSAGIYIQPEMKSRLLNVWQGAPTDLEISIHPKNSFQGDFRGVLFGGNLSVMMSLSGSADDISEADIYIIEDLDEYLYHLDRMVHWFFRSGKLNAQKLLLVGHLSDMKNLNPENPFGKTPEDMVAELAAHYGVPVVFGVPFGHLSDHACLVTGGTYQIRALEGKISIKEIQA